jgi:hypothetical protein
MFCRGCGHILTPNGADYMGRLSYPPSRKIFEQMIRCCNDFKIDPIYLTILKQIDMGKKL